MQMNHSEAGSRTAARRTMVDLLAEARSRAVRVALFGELLHRPDPDGRETTAERDNHLAVLIDTVAWIERTAQLVTSGRDPWDKFPEPLCAWLLGFVAQKPDLPDYLTRMAQVSRRVATAAEAGSKDLGPALRDHYDVRRRGYMTALTDFCDIVWAEIDQQRDSDLDRAEKAMTATRGALTRMEKISTHVRLVAINAAIEANKLGDQGRGIAFIAAEFKALAEELQVLSSDAQKNMAGAQR